jgi:hypothetical protein
MITETGVRCGASRERHYHPNADTVRYCYQEREEAMAMMEAERANERFFEERGLDEALAQDAWEARNGVVSFSDAYRMACPEAFEDMPIDA